MGWLLPKRDVSKIVLSDSASLIWEEYIFRLVQFIPCVAKNYSYIFAPIWNPPIKSKCMTDLHRFWRAIHPWGQHPPGNPPPPGVSYTIIAKKSWTCWVKGHYQEASDFQRIPSPESSSQIYHIYCYRWCTGKIVRTWPGLIRIVCTAVCIGV